MAITNNWDETRPAGTELASTIDDHMRAMKRDIRERMEVEHVWGVSPTEDGKHKRLSLNSVNTTGDQQPTISSTTTWNTVDIVSWMRLVLTRTASGVGSSLINLVVNLNEVFKVSETGEITRGGWPIGSIMAFGGKTVPDGWLACNGQNVSRTTHARLYAAIGTNWGAGDGTTTFTLPNLEGRVLEGALADLSNVGQVKGALSVTLGINNLPPHGHDINDPGHIHSANVTQIQIAVPPSTGLVLNNPGPSSTNTNPAFTGITVGSGPGQVAAPVSVVQPTAVVTYLIRWL